MILKCREILYEQYYGMIEYGKLEEINSEDVELYNVNSDGKLIITMLKTETAEFVDYIIENINYKEFNLRCKTKLGELLYG